MVMIRKYKDYDAYVQHQIAKLPQLYSIIAQKSYRKATVWMYSVLFKMAIKYCLDRKVGGKMLCLGARLGEEVEAWQSFGFDAIGIDLNPGENNKWVTKGDFHSLEFEDESFDYVFSNSVDHVLDINKFNKECYRVLKSGGKALFEVRPHEPASVLEDFKKIGKHAGNPWYESFYWETQEELIHLFHDFHMWKKITYYPFIFYRMGVKKFTDQRPFLVLEK
jgi:SAM-dependent methyltransferase